MGILQTSERSSHLDPSENVIFQRHMIAYIETAKMISGKVLEIGCGEGYGITELAPRAEQYFAVDKYNTPISEELKEQNNITFKQIEVPPLKGIENNFTTANQPLCTLLRDAPRETSRSYVQDPHGI